MTGEVLFGDIEVGDLVQFVFAKGNPLDGQICKVTKVSAKHFWAGDEKFEKSNGHANYRGYAYCVPIEKASEKKAAEQIKQSFLDFNEKQYNGSTDGISDRWQTWQSAIEWYKSINEK